MFISPPDNVIASALSVYTLEFTFKTPVPETFVTPNLETFPPSGPKFRACWCRYIPSTNCLT